ncbi:SURF1 family protein [Sphingomonas sp. GlSt437]|uniref:SURF1 family protein n=1 Tax=Sphingomonas sp. GlSt437 TaxID=3389970 RepID=UPI003A85BBE3
MNRLPILPTAIVALAVAAMVALGFWQLDRRVWKERLLAQYAANQQLPPMAFPVGSTDDKLLYRRAGAFCLNPTAWTVEGAGAHGWRLIAQCRTGAEGPGFAAELGTTHDPNFRPAWRGGKVSGTIIAAPSHASLIEAAFSRAAPAPLMIVADTAPAGLEPSPKPSPASIPNNHLAYAVQWFIFAGLAVVIYALALRRRARAG